MTSTEAVLVLSSTLVVSGCAPTKSDFRKADTTTIQLSLFILLICVLFRSVDVSAQTIISGNVSGTWDIGGSPYLLIDDATVQAGTELTIEPGVEVVIAASMSLNIYGKISAIGTPSQKIFFRAVDDSVKFNRIYVQNGSNIPDTSSFQHCEIKNANTGIYIHAVGRNINSYTTLRTNIIDCDFDASVSTAIYIRAEGVDYSQFMTPRRGHARVSPVIDGCTFDGNLVGINISTQGSGISWFSNGDTRAVIQNNIFIDLTEAGINILPGSINSGSPYIVNNTFVNCGRGVWLQDPEFDAVTINNLFNDTSTAIERSGSASRTAYYNCFYDNEAAFVGYPSTYGDVVITNRNDDPSDLGFNVFLDPLFADPSLRLSNDSPCNNAGIDSIQVDTVWYHAPDHDFGGNPRPMPAGTMPDVGAWEMDSSITNSSGPVVTVPADYRLSQNYPNPFNPRTTIEFTLPRDSYVTLAVYNLVGKQVASLVSEHLAAGSHKYRWDARGLASGVYFYRLEATNVNQSKKLLLLR